MYSEIRGSHITPEVMEDDERLAIRDRRSSYGVQFSLYTGEDEIMNRQGFEPVDVSHEEEEGGSVPQ